jgi:ATP-binding cassette subfamily B protein
MTGGELSQFVLYAVLLLDRGRRAGGDLGRCAAAAGATERLMEILRDRPPSNRRRNPVPLPRAQGRCASSR